MRNTLIPYRPNLRQKARDLRNNSTLSEVLLWQEIKNRQLSDSPFEGGKGGVKTLGQSKKGVQYHRQVPMLDYIVDFYCHELMLAIEIDGISHDHEDTLKKDARRQKRLENKGILFLRFDDMDVKLEMPHVLNEILNTVNELKDEA